MGHRALDRLRSHTWPGNIRELSHAIENAVILCDTNVLMPRDFNMRPSQLVEDENLNLEIQEKNIIAKALLKHNGKYIRAAEELGISRTTLYLKIKKYGL